MNENENPLGTQIDRLTELVVARFAALDQRLNGLEGEAAEIRTLLRAIVSGIERLHARLPADYGEAMYDPEECDDGFLSPAPGQFLH
ncbi:MAG: hypothetical protein WCF85_04575 [Rhodospirillaceae bacterium]